MIKNLLKIFSVLFLIGFSFKDATPPLINGWYKQTIPSLSDSIIRDIHFIDSTTGFLTTWRYLLKTTNSGDNWFLNCDIGTGNYLEKIKFINKDSGMVLAAFSLAKTTNKGENWTLIHFPGIDMSVNGMHILNWDTIWTCGDDGMHGQIYISTNGGQNWVVKYETVNFFENIYFVNKRTGYACTSTESFKTTNGGENWTLYLNDNFLDISFVDSLTGWLCNVYVKKTSDGGANWVQQQLPHTNMSSWYGMVRFSALNKDTIWGVGGVINYYVIGNGTRGIIYKTTNGGLNWGYQLPDTSYNIYQFLYCHFIDAKHGWCYSNVIGGVHTTSGGSDSTIFTGIKKIEITNSPTKFILYQNYPNPFNPSTTISYYLYSSAFVELKVYDISGKLISTLVSKKQNKGNYEYNFNGNNLSSGTYFYNIKISDKEGNIYSESKRMILLK